MFLTLYLAIGMIIGLLIVRKPPRRNLSREIAIYLLAVVFWLPVMIQVMYRNYKK